MKLPWLQRKSSGVRVSRRVFRLIRRANAARDAGRWSEAAEAYAAALDCDPFLSHIWIQLGHALKESGSRSEASDAYRRAGALRPGEVEPFIHLSRATDRQSDFADAARVYLTALERDSADAEALLALSWLVTRVGKAIGPAVLADLKAVFADRREDPTDEGRPTNDGACDDAVLVFDVSDLIAYWSDRRSPTGIQRVQIEIVLGMLDLPDAPSMRICTFVEKMDSWFEIAPSQFRALAASSRTVEGDGWQTDYLGFLLRTVLAEPFAFPRGTWLVNLGSSWWLPNYFAELEAVSRTAGVRYVPFVHDLIAMVAPEHCLDELKIAFGRWIRQLFSRADHFLVNSQSTRRDLLRIAASLGHSLDPGAIVVIRLDGHVATSPSQLGVPVAQPYVLFVSTLESRKGHTVALDAWRRLIARHGAARVPQLVLVGRHGWLNEPIYRRISDHPELERKVTILADVSDQLLAALYRDCLFTLYPSLYEGWGMPITEALAHGKVVIASTSSSLPEAGGDLAVYVTPGSVDELQQAVERLAFDDEALAALAARIAAEHRPRRWIDIAAALNANLSKWRDEAEKPGDILDGRRSHDLHGPGDIASTSEDTPPLPGPSVSD